MSYNNYRYSLPKLPIPQSTIAPQVTNAPIGTTVNTTTGNAGNTGSVQTTITYMPNAETRLSKAKSNTAPTGTPPTYTPGVTSAPTGSMAPGRTADPYATPGVEEPAPSDEPEGIKFRSNPYDSWPKQNIESLKLQIEEFQKVEVFEDKRYEIETEINDLKQDLRRYPASSEEYKSIELKISDRTKDLKLYEANNRDKLALYKQYKAQLESQKINLNDLDDILEELEDALQYREEREKLL